MRASSRLHIFCLWVCDRSPCMHMFYLWKSISFALIIYALIWNVYYISIKGFYKSPVRKNHTLTTLRVQFYTSVTHLYSKHEKGDLPYRDSFQWICQLHKWSCYCFFRKFKERKLVMGTVVSYPLNKATTGRTDFLHCLDFVF